MSGQDFIFCVALKQKDYYLFSEPPLKRYTINHSGELDLRKSTLLSAFPRGEREREREIKKERNASRALDKTVVEHARARKHR